MIYCLVEKLFREKKEKRESAGVVKNFFNRKYKHAKTKKPCMHASMQQAGSKQG